MTNKRNNKASGTSAPKRPTQSPPSGNVQGQGSSASAPSPTSQPSTDNSAKRTRVSSEPVIDQDNILTPPALQDNASTSSPLPLIPTHKRKSVEILPPKPERAASSDASTAAIQSSPFRFYAAAAPSTIEGFWTHFKTNRKACDATDREFSSFSSYGSKATTQGSGDNKIIVVYFRSKPDMEKAIATPISSLHDLQFHEHDPFAKKADEQLLFDSATAMEQFENTHTYVALLAGLPRGSVAADLSEIAEEVSAKSVNIPFSYNSYNPKPYAYVHFSSAATKKSAMRITCALKSIGLTWHEPTDVSSLCHHCGRPGCNLDRCASSRAPQRPSRSSSRSRSHHNNHHHRPHRPSQSEMDQDIAAMDIPPLMDWQQITEQITVILEEITYLTTEFAQLQNRVKWLEDQYSSPPISRS
ncbi:hypothetical protein GLOIN_2v1785090 [Rhizophagus irregularis DAOM 181602=DAOM 197198]|nr:hypothetical protein GLOIN_2v1785090 [Rhizophagus irregularis DAOM 181602=DAOM 197198]